MSGATRVMPERDWAVHPGETLAETLLERGMTQAEFAERMGSSTKHVNEIVKGHSGYTADFAIRMERVLGVSARLWLQLQSNYRLDVARMRDLEASRERDREEAET